MKKLLLVLLVAAVSLAGCVVPSLKMDAQYPYTSKQIVVRYDWANPLGPYGTYVKGERDKAEFANEVNRILSGKLKLGPNDQLVVSVRKVGYLMDTLIATKIQTVMDVTLNANGTPFKKTFTDEVTSDSTNVDDVMRGVRDSVQRVLDQIVGFVKTTRAGS